MKSSYVKISNLNQNTGDFLKIFHFKGMNFALSSCNRKTNLKYESCFNLIKK